MLKTLILIASQLHRQEQISFLESIPELELLEPACDFQSFWEALCSQHPDLVIFDESLFAEPGLQPLRRLKAEYPETACIVFAGKYQQMAQAAAAGADHVLLRGFSAKEFFLALTDIHHKRKTT